MTEGDGRELASIPKWGEPASEWRQDRPNTLTNTFGVLNEQGQTMPGLHVEFEVFVSPRLGQVKYVLSLMRISFGRPERAYQLEVNCRQGLKSTDHAFSHEHYGDDGRYKADSSWANASLEVAVNRFLDICKLTLTEELPDYQGFQLK